MIGPFAYGWKFLLAAVVLIAVWGFGVHHGKAIVQQDWDKETTRVATGLAKNAEAQRAKEYADQQQMNKVQTDATQRLEALRTNADSANAAADRLREQVGKLIATNTVCAPATTGTSRQTASNPGNLLAVVLDKSIQRNRELAAFADSAITAAQACEKARN